LLLSFLRPLAALAALAGLAAYATIMLRGPQGLKALQENRRQVRLLEEQNATLTREIALKKQRIEKLKHDPSTQELEIMKRLKMQHQGDTQYVLPDAKVPSAPSKANLE
jgi:cell division protein FtsB